MPEQIPDYDKIIKTEGIGGAIAVFMKSDAAVELGLTVRNPQNGIEVSTLGEETHVVTTTEGDADVYRIPEEALGSLSGDDSET